MSTLTAGQRLGPYEVESSIGAGGMGEVYRARDTRLNRTVAIKVSQEQFSERFEREACAIAALNHPNICTLHDVGPNYLVMELVDGPTLADRIAAGAIPLEESLRIARQIGDALEAAHEQGIVHRDLKPANIKIKADGLVKVLDFGLAKAVGTPAVRKSDDSPTISMAATQAGVILGTAAYMAPEQARGKPVDKRADIWSFGVVLYEMVTGRRLFEGEDLTETLALVIKGEPKWDEIPVNLKRLLESCLEKDPNRRLRDIGDAWRLLEAPSLPAPDRLTAPWLWRALAAVAAVAAVAVVIASVLAFVHFGEKPPSTELVRFEIASPAQSSFSGSPVVSPDGRRVAFDLRGADGRTQLWIRSLDSLGSQPVAGTEGGGTSFWSPDSRFLAFVAHSKLKKVDASGGPPQVVCDVPMATGDGKSGFRGGAWNRDGVIIFGAAGTGLWRVSEAGGTPAPLTKLDASRREVFHGHPDFLPDGRHFLYEHRVPLGEGGHAIHLGSIDAKPEQQSSRPLVAGTSSSAVYVPASDQGTGTGHILFTRGVSLLAQAFDARKLDVTGEAATIAEISVAGGPRPFSASRSGALVYRTGARFAFTTTQLTWFDRHGRVVGTAGEPDRYNSLALSPDGTRVAVSRLDSSLADRGSGRPPYDIWVHEFSRGTSSRLTSDPAAEGLATWSPNGSRIIYSSERPGSVFNLYQKASSGAGDEELLLKSNDDKLAQDWSRDGRFLLYSVTVGGRDGRATSQDLWVLPLTPGNTHDLKPEAYLKSEFNESQARFSPDGRFIAYGSDASGRDEIYVRPFPAASGDKWTVSTGGGVAPRWRADGKELFYVSSDSKMTAVDVSTHPVFKAGIPKTLFQAPILGGSNFRDATRYDVAADGNKFLLNSVLAGAWDPAAAPITVVLNWTGLLKK